MSKYVVAIMSAAEVGALHHIITDELETGFSTSRIRLC